MTPLDPEQRKKIISDAFKESGFYDRHKVPEPTDVVGQCAARAGQVTASLWSLLDQVVRADHLKGGKFDESAFYSLAFKMSMDNFREWSKDDLLTLAALVHSEFLLEKGRDLSINL